MEKRVLALDFGASSARAMRAVTDGTTLTVEELHRWDNVPIEKNGHLYWDIDTLFHEICISLKRAAQAGGVDAIGIDTWGVDFGLLDENGHLLENPVHYRDARTSGILERALSRMPAQTLYQHTGIQIMEINTVFQLFSMTEQHSECLKQAKTLLLMPDLFAYLLTGQIGAEYSIASTTGLLDCNTGNWSDAVCTAFGIPRTLLPPLSPAGSIRGTLLPELCAQSGLPPIPIIAVAGHDTASAIMAAPVENDETAFLSCGTWSLLGTVLHTPVLTEQARQGALTNEGGYGNTITLLTNLTGLWLVQESRRQWIREGQSFPFAELEEMALHAHTTARIDTQDSALSVPGNTPAYIRAQCADRQQEIPQSPGEIVRCIYESLADTYAQAIQHLQACTGRKLQTITLVGGGARGTLLPQLTADRTGCTVLTGPVEATVLGNVLAQFLALDIFPDLTSAKKLLETQEQITVYKPNRKA
ncbi:MAG: rhamnulokinase [Butyricicoccus pullicaecorum]|nr:rhamnulokinase [Butyricicoccus pullicaecorum]MBS5165761.1 rhamnulokinase [Butyricicoccus pullicaecorum]